MTAEQVKQLIEQGMDNAQASVRSPDGVHFEAVVVSPEFADKGVVTQHRLVYAALGARMGNEIHALSLKTLTPEQAASG